MESGVISTKRRELTKRYGILVHRGRLDDPFFEKGQLRSTRRPGLLKRIGFVRLKARLRYWMNMPYRRPHLSNMRQ